MSGPVVVTAPFESILPFILTVLPMVVAALVTMLPAKTLFVPSVVPPVGTQNTLLDFALPVSTTFELATVSSAPFILKM